MSTLKGKTVLITGASRGIGLAIALRCAADGANIVVFANEARLPNLASTAEQIQAAGGVPLVLDVDVRDGNAIKQAVTEAINRFGIIDILINNTSAFCFTDTLHTSIEEFDKLISTNVRATFLVSQACLPYLQHAINPHIINISPPLLMEAHWFVHHLPFTMSKYGMSTCTLGMAAEFKNKGIAVNSLWPQTTIGTTTITDHFTSSVYAGSRRPTIVADAAYILMQRLARECTGQFFMDEELLRETGITDFTQYAVDMSAKLVQDLFVPEDSNRTDYMTALSQDLFLKTKEIVK